MRNLGEAEVRYFWKCAAAFREAIAQGDGDVADEWGNELAGILYNTENPDLRRRCNELLAACYFEQGMAS